jgi:ABC-type multidrug transport system ATPase subunit
MSFSGGMKRRLSVAISAIGDPKIIFMDEPTTGMDPVSRKDVWTLI